MKHTPIIVLCLAALLVSDGCTGRPAAETVTVSGAFALYPLAVRWKDEYVKTHPGAKIEVAAGGAGKGMTDVLGGLVDIAMVSRDVNPVEEKNGATGFAVAKDAVIPVMNGRHPAAALLRKRGLTVKECAGIWIGRSITGWSQIAGVGGQDAIHVYSRADACGAGEVWAKFLGGKSQDALGGVQVSGDPGLAEAVIRDPLGIGYNNINFAYDPSTLLPVEGLEPVRLDFNADGRIDPVEDVYATRDALVAAIRDGRFPSPPARNLFFVTKGIPARPAVREFIRWSLEEGQAFIDESGYIRIREEEIASSRRALAAP